MYAEMPDAYENMLPLTREGIPEYKEMWVGAITHMCSNEAYDKASEMVDV